MNKEPVREWAGEEAQPSTMGEDWRERFYKQFVHENMWKSDNEDTSYVGIGNIEAFIATELSKARESALEEGRCNHPKEVTMTPEEICAKYTFSDFFRFATEEEKRIVMLAVAREASEEQRKVVYN